MFADMTTEEKLSMLKGLTGHVSYFYSLSKKSFHYSILYDIL